MKNTALQHRLGNEVMQLLHDRRSLQLATVCEDGSPYASYAPYALGDDCLYVLLSDIAVHGVNLVREPRASVLIIEDEATAGELFARVRVHYRVRGEEIPPGSDAWQQGVDRLTDRHGERPRRLSELADFRLFRLAPLGGRYVKGFGRAYDLAGAALAGTVCNPRTDGHRERQPQTAGA